MRVQSKKQYNDGLFIFDVIHTPYACAAWPALWLTDPSNWPTNGEIDVMESVNQGTNGNQMTLHTTAGCSMGVKREETATVLTKNCDAYDSDNAGCGVDGKSDSFGAALNSAGGAIVALEWRNAGIRMWQFPHDSAPADITSASPTPNSWGTATADFPSTDCDISSHFKNQSIIVNIDLCGTLTNSVWAKSGCKFPSESTTGRSQETLTLFLPHRLQQLHRHSSQPARQLQDSLLGVWEVSRLPGFVM